MSKEIQLLKEASLEIKSLRRQNELMRARLDMFDAVRQILHANVVYQGEGMSPDLAWAIDKHVAERENEAKTVEPPSK